MIVTDCKLVVDGVTAPCHTHTCYTTHKSQNNFKLKINSKSSPSLPTHTFAFAKFHQHFLEMELQDNLFLHNFFFVQFPRFCTNY